MLALNLGGVDFDSQNNQDQHEPEIPLNIRLGSRGPPGAGGRPGAIGSPAAVDILQILSVAPLTPDLYPGDDPIPTTSTSRQQNCRPTSVCEKINTNKRGIVSFANMSCFYYMIGGHYKCFGAEN